MKSSSSSSSGPSDPEERHYDVMPHTTQKMLAALFYGISSILVIFTNKWLMNGFNFPYIDFIATIQFIVTTVILFSLIMMKKIEVPPLSWTIVCEVLPITIMFLGNVLCGLGSTKALSIPMFTALRRFSMFLIMLAEWCLLHIKPSLPVFLAICLMVSGTVIAACFDLSYDAFGYTLVFCNNIFTALNGVYMKKASISGKCSKMGVLFYNSLFSAIIMFLFFTFEHFWSVEVENDGTTSAVVAAAAMGAGTGVGGSPSLRGGVDSTSFALHTTDTISLVFQHPGWHDSRFLLMMILSACMGSILNYSILLCTTINSALTTAVVGTTKNIATTYIGMVAFSDYSFNWINFLGINVSIIGSIYYSYITIFKGASGYGQA